MHPASGVCDQWKWPTNSDEIWYFNIVQKSLYPNHFVVVEEPELLAHSNLKNNWMTLRNIIYDQIKL